MSQDSEKNKRQDRTEGGEVAESGWTLEQLLAEIEKCRAHMEKLGIDLSSGYDIIHPFDERSRRRGGQPRDGFNPKFAASKSSS